MTESPRPGLRPPAGQCPSPAQRAPKPGRNAMLFFNGARIGVRGGKYVVDPANWKRLRLLLQPFKSVDMIAVKHPAPGEDWLPLPASVRVIFGQRDFQPLGEPSSAWKKVRFLGSLPAILLRFIHRAVRAPAVGFIWLLEPVAVAGLLSAVLTRKPLYSVVVGSPKKSFQARRASRGSWTGRHFNSLAAFAAAWVDRQIASRSRLLLTTGPRLSRELGAGTPFSTSLFAAADIHDRHDTCVGDTIRWIYVGGISYQKGVDTLLRAFAIARSKDPRHHLVLAGNPDPAFPLKEILEAEGIADAVTSLGRVDWPRVIEALRDSDVFVFLSLHEGMPKAPLEAMSQGLPVIATATGAEQYLEPDVNGVLVPVSDANATANAVARVVVDGRLRRKLIANSLATARHYTYEAGERHVRAVLLRAFPTLTDPAKRDWNVDDLTGSRSSDGSGRAPNPGSSNRSSPQQARSGSTVPADTPCDAGQSRAGD